MTIIQYIYIYICFYFAIDIVYRYLSSCFVVLFEVLKIKNLMGDVYGANLANDVLLLYYYLLLLIRPNFGAMAMPIINLIKNAT